MLGGEEITMHSRYKIWGKNDDECKARRIERRQSTRDTSATRSAMV